MGLKLITIAMKANLCQNIGIQYRCQVLIGAPLPKSSQIRRGLEKRRQVKELNIYKRGGKGKGAKESRRSWHGTR